VRRPRVNGSRGPRRAAGEPRAAMFTSFETAFGASAYNWLLVIVAGVVIVAGATLLPSLLQRCRRRGRRPLP